MSQRKEEQLHVILPPGIPPEMAGIYARSVIDEATARAANEEARKNAEREKRENIEAQLAQVAKEQKAERERKAEEEEERAAREFDERLRASYFESNPNASQADWARDRRSLKAAAMQQRALDQFEGRSSEEELMMESLLRSGRYRRL